MNNFENRVVVVTGASGISMGKTFAENFFKNGAKLAICSSNAAKIAASAEEIAPGGSQTLLAMPVDVSSVKALNEFAQAVVNRFGRIDIWVNNAGISFPKPSLDVTEEDWDRTVGVNLKGCFFGCQCAARVMLRQESGGCIINIGSVNQTIVNIGETVYAATKSGISKMTENLAREWGPDGIRVNCIAPGSVPTQMNKEHYADIRVHNAMCEKIPLRRRGTKEEISDVLLFLASEQARYITGQTIFVDGGLSVVRG